MTDQQIALLIFVLSALAALSVGWHSSKQYRKAKAVRRELRESYKKEWR